MTTPSGEFSRLVTVGVPVSPVGLLGTWDDTEQRIWRSDVTKGNTDLRTLSSMMGGGDSLDLLNSVLDVESPSEDWPPIAPRTCPWLNAILNQGLTETGRHAWWKLSFDLAVADMGWWRSTKFFCEVLEVGVVYDGTFEVLGGVPQRRIATSAPTMFLGCS